VLKVTVSNERFPEGGLLAEWRDLLEDAEFATPFQTPAWTESWMRHFGANKKPLWITVRAQDDLVGLFPLYVSSSPWRTLRPIGCGQSDYLNPLVRNGFADGVANETAQYLKTFRGADLVDLHQQPETLPFDNTGGETLEQAACLVLDLPTSYEEYLKSLSKSLRFDCRRLGKPPFATGEAKVRQAAPEETEGAIGQFFRLHAQRWRKRGLPGSFATRQLKAFHTDAAANLAKEGHLRLTLLESGAETVGVLYGMQVGKTRFFYQCGFDPQYKALSPGTLLVAKAIDCAIAEGCTTFDFMRGDEAYKRRWNPQRIRRNLRYIMPLNSGLGAVGGAINHAGSRIEAKVRERLEGRGFFG
jgi:CelD/BcsL family acetyltransferase involved in cellulose biosynthesis